MKQDVSARRAYRANWLIPYASVLASHASAGSVARISPRSSHYPACTALHPLLSVRLKDSKKADPPADTGRRVVSSATGCAFKILAQQVVNGIGWTVPVENFPRPSLHSTCTRLISRREMELNRVPAGRTGAAARWCFRSCPAPKDTGDAQSRPVC